MHKRGSKHTAQDNWHKQSALIGTIMVLTLGITNVSSCSLGRLLDRSDGLFTVGDVMDCLRLGGSEPGVGLGEMATGEDGRRKLGKPACCWGPGR